MAIKLWRTKEKREDPKVEDVDEEVYEYKPFNAKNFFLRPKYIRE